MKFNDLEVPRMSGEARENLNYLLIVMNAEVKLANKLAIVLV